jgi:molecular chaperone Hsp33
VAEQDKLRRFLFENAPMRGHWVRLESSWRAAREHQHLAPPVRDLLGEALVATTLLAGALKFKGTLTLQLSGGTGLVSMLIAQCTNELALRGVAHMAETKAGVSADTELDANLHESRLAAATFAELAGKGQLIVTVEQGEGAPPWQGIVPLEGDCLAACLERYFEASEQLPTRIVLAANVNHAAGMLLQKLPTPNGAGEADEARLQEQWDEASLFVTTVTGEELLGAEPGRLLQNVFAEQDLRLFEGEPVRFGCRCGRARVASMLQSLGRQEVDSIIAEQGAVTVTCEFCRAPYRYDAVDAELLFHANVLSPAPDSLN